ncbi:MAG: DNA repair exonuclease [Blautia sp.]|nr:DNA repair exonuclease [Blautia sp.]
MKFIHLADVHLGAVPDRGTPWSQAREEEIWNTFRRVIAGIRENPVDFLFIAGDLFHRQPLPSDLKEVNYLFSTIPYTRVYLMAGNHDYLKTDSAYRNYPWSENVVFFQDEQLACVKDDRENVYVYGLSYEHQEITGSLYENARPGQEEGYHILLAHGGDDKHIPMCFSRMAETGFDYIAMGHIHKPQVLFENQIVYPGALEPIDRNDNGPHGYVEGWTQEGRICTRFVPFAARSYYRLSVKVNEESTQISLEDTIRGAIRKRGTDHIYQITLNGMRSPEILLIPERIKRLGNIIEVNDETKIAYDLERLYRKHCGTIVGDYIAYFRKDKRDATQEKALYYGLQALLETSSSK